MKNIITIILAVMTFISAKADEYSYAFSDTPMSEAIVAISKEHPDIDISFIYKELDNYRTSAKVETDDAYDALRQTIGLNPVTVIKKGNQYYIEALQHGLYCYTGRAVGSDHEPVAAATVMLLSPSDSTVITYGITDAEGRFSIPCDRRGVIGKLSCLGYATTHQMFDSFVVGIVSMAELPMRLQAVNVDAANAYTSTDKTVFRPTQRQKNASQTAIDLLRNLALPLISVNLVNDAVMTLGGDPVAIYVNGLPASAEELQGLRPADVRMVEYLDFPTDPRYNGNDHVINFVMQRYEYGGYTKLSVSENALVGLSSRASAYSKFTYKSMIYDLYAGASNHSIRDGGTSRIGTYSLADDVNVTRDEHSDYSRFRYNQYPVTFRAVYDSDKVQIGNTVAFNFDQSPKAETRGTLSYSPNQGNDYSYTNSQPYTTRHFVCSGAYYFVLPHNCQLSINPRANFGHTDYTYSYSASIPGSETIETSSKENYSVLSAGASIYKGFTEKHSAMANLYGGTNRNEVNYAGASTFSNSFADSYTGLRLGYIYNDRRWRFDANAALQWEKNGINGRYVSEAYPLINVGARFSPSPRHSVNVYLHYGANYPGESIKTTNVLQDNEMMYKTGNPDISLSRQVNFNVQYNWMPCNAFAMASFMQFYGEYGLYVPVFERYDNGHALLRTYSSGQDYNRTQIAVSFNLKLLGGSLQLSAQPSVSIFRYRGCYNMSKAPFSLNSSLTYYLSRFYLQASYQSANRTINGNQGVWYRTRDFYQLQAGWGNANWNIRLSAINMLRGDWLAATSTLSSPLYSETMLQSGTYYHRRLNLSITYTIGYGKKIQRANEVGEQSAAPSAILK